MVDFHLYLGQDVKLHPSNSSSPQYKAEVIAKDSTSLDLKVLHQDQIEDISIFKQEQNWTLSYEDSNNLYQLDVAIKTIITRSDLILTATPLKKARKIERRRYMRVKVKAPIKYRLIDDKELQPARLVDISASGIKMEVNNITNLRMEKKIVIKFNSIADFPLPEIQGRILRIKVNQNAQEQKKKYSLGVEFVAVPPSQREQLITWVQSKKSE